MIPNVRYPVYLYRIPLMVMNSETLIPHLFRAEFGKITAVLTRLIGFEHIEDAEDIASATFAKAVESWTFGKIPENPRAWLYAVAKNQALNWIKRHQNFQLKLKDYLTLNPDESGIIDLSDDSIRDSQLSMLFAICHPAIAQQDQIALALRILCGFGIEEISNAFLSNKEAIQKRIYRAKNKLRQEGLNLESPSVKDRRNHLQTVLTMLYLLFNEGYYSESNDTIIREDLAGEAIRLTDLLLQDQHTRMPEVFALMALMCFQASRFPARRDSDGHLILYEDQNQELWDQNLIARGTYFFHQAAQGNQLTRFHLEAGIAYWHTQKGDRKDKWENILDLYNHLLVLEYSPIAALNRTFALSKVRGKDAARQEALKLKLDHSPYYHSLLCELYLPEHPDQAVLHLRQAIDLVKTNTEKALLLQKLMVIQNT